MAYSDILYHSLDAPTYKLVQQLCEADRRDKMQFRSRQELEAKATELCDQMNEEILDYVEHGFEKMLRNPKFKAFIDFLDKKIGNGMPNCVDIRSFSTGTITYVNDEAYWERSMDVYGIKPSDFGLPSRFDFKELYDFWALVLGLIKHIPHECVEFTNKKGEVFLHYDSDTALYNHMILDQLYTITISTYYDTFTDSCFGCFAPQLFGLPVFACPVRKNGKDAEDVFDNFLHEHYIGDKDYDRAIKIHIRYVPPEAPEPVKESWY